MKKFQGWLSIQVAKKPARTVLFTILFFNVLFFLLAAFVISRLSLTGTEKMGFFEAAFYTVSMILDAGCISYVIEDIGQSGVLVAVICLLIVLIGMVSFTGAVIGYITNYISSFIDNANTGAHRLLIRNHMVILNWNNRGAEIVNDLLYSDHPETVVVLVDSQRDAVLREVEERLSETVRRENTALWKELVNRRDELRFGLFAAYRHRRMKNRVTVLVRQGNVYSTKQLRDVSLEYAKTAIILGNDDSRDNNPGDSVVMQGGMIGNPQTVKTLMQVADITGADYSADGQRIIVEITDEWTAQLVERVIRTKQVDGKCSIVPVYVNRILGQLLSQFSLMPELNFAYRDLFSNKGATFYSVAGGQEDEDSFIRGYLENHTHALPLTCMPQDGQLFSFYSAGSEADIDRKGQPSTEEYRVRLNPNYWIEEKHVVIVGHNSKIRDIMEGFKSFCSEWDRPEAEGGILKILVIDDPEFLEQADYYREWPFVVQTVGASVSDRDTMYTSIDDFILSHEGVTSVLILSDDTVPEAEIDSRALSNLIYEQDIIETKVKADPAFDRKSLEVVVELIDPKHHDLVSNYSVNNVVISNRYISRMISQIGEKDALFGFYNDILSYDDTSDYESKEIYIKRVDRMFTQLPAPCTADQLVRAVYEASTEPGTPLSPTIVLGYVKADGSMHLFSGDLTKIPVRLGQKDKLVVFTDH